MPSYLYQAPNGVKGDISRSNETSVEPAMLIAVSSVFAQAFGIPMKYATGGISQMGAGAVAADFCGILARSAPEISGSTAQTFDTAVPNPDQPQNLVVRGYVNVQVLNGTPARGGVVYVRITASGGFLVGALEAAADGGNSVALSLTQASWASDGVDADGNAEIRVAR